MSFAKGDVVQIVANNKNLCLHYIPMGSIGRITGEKWSTTRHKVEFGPEVARDNGQTFAKGWPQWIEESDLVPYVGVNDAEEAWDE